VSDAAPNENTSSNPRLEKASHIVSSSCGWAFASGLIPLPIIDLAALAAVQVRMADSVANVYGQSFKKEVVEGTIAVLLGTLLPTAVSGTVASGVKAIPGIGTILGLATFPALASASTYAMGKVLVRHFEKGGTASDFSPEAVKESLQREFASAKAKPA